MEMSKKISNLVFLWPPRQKHVSWSRKRLLKSAKMQKIIYFIYASLPLIYGENSVIDYEFDGREKIVKAA